MRPAGTHETASQRTPDRSSQPLVTLEQRLVLDLELLPVQHRVLGLFAGRSDQVELVGDGVSFLDLLGGPLGGTAGAKAQRGTRSSAFED